MWVWVVDRSECPCKRPKILAPGFCGGDEAEPGMEAGKKSCSGAVLPAGHMECRCRSSCGPRLSVRCARPRNRACAPCGSSLSSCAAFVAQANWWSQSGSASSGMVNAKCGTPSTTSLLDRLAKGSYVLVADIGALEPDEQLRRELRCWS